MPLDAADMVDVFGNHDSLVYYRVAIDWVIFSSVLVKYSEYVIFIICYLSTLYEIKASFKGLSNGNEFAVIINVVFHNYCSGIVGRGCPLPQVLLIC